MKIPLKRISQVATVVMGTSPKGHTYNTSGEGMPLLNGPTEFGLRHPECTVYTTASVKECETGDLIFCVRGSTTGRMNWADKAYSLGRGVCAIRGEDELDTQFIAYSLTHRLSGLLQLAGGATFPNLPQDTINSFEIPFPTTRKRIASTLASYDSLIENNHRRMALLESVVRLLYQEWFVRLRFPGHDNTQIINGVPEGWHSVPLDSMIDVTHGFAFQGEHFTDEASSRILTTPGNFRVGGGIKLDKLKFYAEDAPLEPKDVLAPMDLILTMTDLSQMSDTLGFPALVPKLSGHCFLHNQRIGKVIPIGEFFPKHFLYQLFCDPRYRQHVLGSATGTSVKHTSPKRIISYTALMPKSHGLIKRFEDFAAPAFEQINTLTQTNEKLRAARDLLLPQLISGEIAVHLMP